MISTCHAGWLMLARSALRAAVPLTYRYGTLSFLASSSNRSFIYTNILFFSSMDFCESPTAGVLDEVA